MTDRPEANAIPDEVMKAARMAVFGFETRVQSDEFSNPEGGKASEALVNIIARAIMADRTRNAGSGAEPDGWKLVPVKPTENMLDHGSCYEDPDDLYADNSFYHDGDIARDVYSTMLKHAPPSPGASLSGGAQEAFAALDIADRLLERAYGADMPKEWNDAYRSVAAARSAAPAAPDGEVVRELVKAATYLLSEIDAPNDTESVVMASGKLRATLAKIGGGHGL